MYKIFVLLNLVFMSATYAIDNLNDYKYLSGDLDSIKDNKKELVVFWATWCPECKEKLTNVMPKIFKENKIAILTVNTEKEIDRVKAFLEKNKILMPTINDDNKNLRKSLKIFSVPAWAVYERQNVQDPWNLVGTGSGFSEEDINKALGEKIF